MAMMIMKMVVVLMTMITVNILMMTQQRCTAVMDNSNSNFRMDKGNINLLQIVDSLLICTQRNETVMRLEETESFPGCLEISIVSGNGISFLRLSWVELVTFHSCCDWNGSQFYPLLFLWKRDRLTHRRVSTNTSNSDYSINYHTNFIGLTRTCCNFMNFLKL